jgi:hypothetical protein
MEPHAANISVSDGYGLGDRVLILGKGKFLPSPLHA